MLLVLFYLHTFFLCFYVKNVVYDMQNVDLNFYADDASSTINEAFTQPHVAFDKVQSWERRLFLYAENAELTLFSRNRNKLLHHRQIQ